MTDFAETIAEKVADVLEQRQRDRRPATAATVLDAAVAASRARRNARNADFLRRMGLPVDQTTPEKKEGSR